MYRLLILFFLTIPLSIVSQSGNNTSLLDSIISLRKLADDKSISLEKRLQYAEQSVDLALKTKVDSTLLLSTRKLSFIHLLMDNYIPYRDISYVNMDLAKRLKDTVSLAYTYNNLGYYHASRF